MTRTEIITRLCEMVAGIAELREKLTDADWQLDAALKDVSVRLQMAMHDMEKGGKE